MVNKIDKYRVLFLDFPRFWKLCISVSVDAFLCFDNCNNCFFSDVDLLKQLITNLC